MKTLKRLIGTAVIPSVVAAGVLLAPSAAHAASGTALDTLNIRASASTSAKIVGTVKKGAAVSFDCYVNGTAVKGIYGTSKMWLRVGGNSGRWVSEAWVYTGTNSATVKPCAAPKPAAPKPSTSSKSTKAVAWAKSKVGSYSYDFLCERFVENAYGTQGKYGSAIANYNAQKKAGRINTSRTNIPVGALVFSSVRAWDQGYGHVQISIGGGKFVSGGMGRNSAGRLVAPTVQYRTGLPSGYLGWSHAPTSWPGR